MTQIITLGGGGFLSATDPQLDLYLLQQTKVKTPKIGFIGTASGDDTRFVVRFFSRFSSLDCKPSALSLFGRVQNLTSWINQQDIIFVGGGNTKSMLGVWQAWDIPVLLENFLHEGKVLAGVSAGAICWFESGITDSSGEGYVELTGLGFLPGCCCPHYDSEPDRKPVFERIIETGEVNSGIAIDDGVAVHWVDGKAANVVSARPSASAYSMSLENGSLISERLSTTEISNATIR